MTNIPAMFEGLTPEECKVLTACLREAYHKFQNWQLEKLTAGQQTRIAYGEADLLYEDELRHTCGECGAKLQLVRPGKYQCVNPECCNLVGVA